MNYEGEKFLLKLYQDLDKKDEVLKAEKESGKSSGNKYELLKKYLNRLERQERIFSGEHTELEQYLKNRYYDKYVIKIEDIPNSYWETQQRIALERGYGHIEYTKSLKRKEAKQIIEEQKRSLETWINYLMKENTSYPMWTRYWAFQGMLKLGKYDKGNGTFSKRSKGTTSPFIGLNAEALAHTIGTVQNYYEGKSIDDKELEELIKSGNFGKIYSYNMWKLIENEKKNQNNKIDTDDGIWKVFKKKDTKKLVKALEGKGTGWCIAGESVARDYLKTGDIHIYFTEDQNGEYTMPRVCIRQENENIAEVRGIEKDQNLESAMIDITDKKLDEFYDKDIYKKKVSDMKELTSIYNTGKNKGKLTDKEYIFLYEIEHEIEGFGWEKDPRIEELKEIYLINNKNICMKYINKYGHESNIDYIDKELLKDKEIIINIIKRRIDILDRIDEKFWDDKEIMQEAIKYNIENLKYTSTLRSDEKFMLEAAKIDAKALGYADEKLVNDPNFMLEAIQINPETKVYIGEKLKNDKEFILNTSTLINDSLRFASEDLKNDKKLALELIKKEKQSVMPYISKELQDDKEVVLEAVKQSGYSLNYASERLKNDKDIVIEAVKKSGGSIKYAGDKLKDDKDIALIAVKDISIDFDKLSERLKNDKDVVKAAVENTNYVLRYTNEDIRSDREIALKAMNFSGSEFKYLSKDLQSDKEIIMEAVKHSSSSDLGNNPLRYIDERLKNDKAIVLEAVKKVGRALEYAGESMKNNKEVVLEAVKNDGLALKYASENLKNDKAIALEAIQNSREFSFESSPLQYVGENLKNDKEMVLEAVKKSGRALKYASENLKNNKEIVLDAVSKNGDALEYASKEMKNDKDIVLKAVTNFSRAFSYASRELKNDTEIVKEVLKNSGYVSTYDVNPEVIEEAKRLLEEEINEESKENNKTR